MSRTRGLPEVKTRPKSLLLSSSVSLEPPGPGRERGQPVLLDRLAEAEPVLPLLELLRLGGDLVAGRGRPRCALVVVVVRVDHDLDVERLALLDLGGDVDGRDLDLGVLAGLAAGRS